MSQAHQIVVVAAGGLRKSKASEHSWSGAVACPAGKALTDLLAKLLVYQSFSVREERQSAIYSQHAAIVICRRVGRTLSRLTMDWRTGRLVVWIRTAGLMKTITSCDKPLGLSV
jgi:hypothetical protein